ncbi:MAG: anthranilate synthase component I family protein [Crocinitomicaceae bacterium]
MNKNLSLNLKIDWKQIVPKIEPDTLCLLLENDQNFTLAWGVGTQWVAKKKLKWSDFQKFRGNYKNTTSFGYLGYDVKNSIEPFLSSKNKDFQKFPLAYFFVPKHVLKVNSNSSTYSGVYNLEEIEKFLNSAPSKPKNNKSSPVNLSPQTSKEEYIHNVEKIKSHIQKGDLYEMTYCINFVANVKEFNPFNTFIKLNKHTNAPFSAYLNTEWGAVLSASPERFLKKKADSLISQPIKGTAPRHPDKIKDEQIKNDLREDIKERAENVMIVDLVRNDLSKIAQKKSVEVDELFGVYTFQTVHQLISTVKCKIKPATTDSEIFKALFPMGSMTGAPKINAMKFADKFENFKRGIYSGAIGSFDEKGDFDFNVVIRSIIYNKTFHTLSAPVGGAITIKSNPEKEYQECLTKLEALNKALC